MVFSPANIENEGLLTVDQIMRGSSVNIEVNDDVGHFFKTKKCVRQGDPPVSYLI